MEHWFTSRQYPQASMQPAPYVSPSQAIVTNQFVMQNDQTRGILFDYTNFWYLIKHLKKIMFIISEMKLGILCKYSIQRTCKK